VRHRLFVLKQGRTPQRIISLLVSKEDSFNMITAGKVSETDSTVENIL
jgi:hypothetical protein